MASFANGHIVGGFLPYAAHGKDENLVAVLLDEPDDSEAEHDKTYEEICDEVGWNDIAMLL